jgi:hypothetical protein
VIILEPTPLLAVVLLVPGMVAGCCQKMAREYSRISAFHDVIEANIILASTRSYLLFGVHTLFDDGIGESIDSFGRHCCRSNCALVMSAFSRSALTVATHF